MSLDANGSLLKDAKSWFLFVIEHSGAGEGQTMGLLRKVTSLSTLGLVSFHSSKERERLANAKLAKAQAEHLREQARSRRAQRDRFKEQTGHRAKAQAPYLRVQSPNDRAEIEGGQQNRTEVRRVPLNTRRTPKAVKTLIFVTIGIVVGLWFLTIVSQMGYDDPSDTFTVEAESEDAAADAGVNAVPPPAAPVEPSPVEPASCAQFREAYEAYIYNAVEHAAGGFEKASKTANMENSPFRQSKMEAAAMAAYAESTGDLSPRLAQDLIEELTAQLTRADEGQCRSIP